MGNLLKYFFISIILFILAVVAFFALGGPMWQSHVRASHDRDIQKFSRAIETASDDATRAQAYSGRGGVYSEKARYNRMFKFITWDEYLPLFDAAISDHSRAIELYPIEPQFFFARGMAYYNRAVAIDTLDAQKESYFSPAAADFTHAAELNRSDVLAWDMLGLAQVSAKRYEEAVAAFKEVLKLDEKRGNWRLADAYCQKAHARFQGGMVPAAILDYEKSLEYRSLSDPCECDAYNALAGLYVQRGEWALANKVVARAAAAQHPIVEETLKALAEKTAHQ